MERVTNRMTSTFRTSENVVARESSTLMNSPSSAILRLPRTALTTAASSRAREFSDSTQMLNKLSTLTSCHTSDDSSLSGSSETSIRLALRDLAQDSYVVRCSLPMLWFSFTSMADSSPAGPLSRTSPIPPDSVSRLLKSENSRSTDIGTNPTTVDHGVGSNMERYCSKSETFVSRLTKRSMPADLFRPLP